MRWLSAILLLVWLSPCLCSAQDELVRDMVRISVMAGYASYALPVANSALARDWASGGVFAWQAGANYSTIPVQVDIEHRLATAFRGRVEVTSLYGYAAEEDPLGHVTLVSREFLIPPAVPTTLVLAPRVCPPSRPGGVTRLRVRLYQQGIQAPWSEELVTVTQLEPAHLYSLYLDGPPGGIYRDRVNPDNELRLAFPWPDADTRLLESDHYSISVDRHTVTALPLAARDFAFAAADYAAVSRWPEAEQQALLVYVLGGGHLCLFNAPPAVSRQPVSTTWQGLPLTGAAQQAGRGWLVPVPGGFDAARERMASWLAGELTEVVLWAGGACGEAKLTRASGPTRLPATFRLDQLYRASAVREAIPSHRPGFLHPVWLYRETCRAGAVEPWDYPEFIAETADVEQANTNLRVALRGLPTTVLEPLSNLAGSAHRFPPGLLWLALAFPAVILLLRLPARRRYLAGLAGIAVLGGGAYVWWQAVPLPPRPVRLVLVDADVRCPAAAARELAATSTSRLGDADLATGADALLRRVAWEPPGDWQWDGRREQASWRGTGGGAYVALTSDAPAEAPAEWPVAVRVERVDARYVRVQLDTTGLGDAGRCLLRTPTGWTVLPGGREHIQYELALPVVPVDPGLERLAAWSDTPGLWWRGGSSYPPQVSADAQVLLRAAGEGQWPQPGASPLQRLAWAGLLQDPTSVRGSLCSQGVVLAPLRTDERAETETSSCIRFVRLTFPLEPTP